MTHDDLQNFPGDVPNSHRLTQEVLRACSFAVNLNSSEKALQLISFFNDTIAFLERELLSEDVTESEKVLVAMDAESPFQDKDVKEVKSASKKKSK